ncbi:MAG: DUF6691 family protein [Tistlia sp.]|uniref:DUF6691 family protein n=1 Tax=Tistlia sp. TaxID=3057121 RepID=UPI0034A440DD
MAVLRLLAALGSGALFGLGLAVSGMVDPARVRGFLDVTGAWDPTLGFVLAGAVGVAFVGFRLVRGRERPLLEAAFELPTRRSIDRPLVAGALLFGVGWGLAGFCPGPAVAALSFAGPQVLLFVAAMLVGMLLHDRFAAPRLARSTHAPAGSS